MPNQNSPKPNDQRSNDKTTNPAPKVATGNKPNQGTTNTQTKVGGKK